MKRQPSRQPDDTLRADSLRRMVEVVLPAARERAQVLDDMRAALLRGEDVTALARRLCGLPPVEITQ